MQQPPAPAAAALLLVLLATDSSQTVLLHRAREEASQFLRQRHRRAYQIFEETKQGHLERECVEELCNKEEAREVFENDPETDYFFPKYLACIHQYGSPYIKSPDFHTCVHNLPNQCTPDPCHKAGTANCEDLKGGYHCHCRKGWQGERCEKDVNECADQNGGCKHTCYNKLGSYHCSCYNGYALMKDSKTCEDIDECTVSPGICGEARCKNLISSYMCVCDAGYNYDDVRKVCKDVDECEQNLCEQTCVNTPGSYSCHCNGKGGVKLSSDMNTCEDILPCVTFAAEKSVKSLYLGRMFSGAPIIRLRFKRKQPTRWKTEEFFTSSPCIRSTCGEGEKQEHATGPVHGCLRVECNFCRQEAYICTSLNVQRPLHDQELCAIEYPDCLESVQLLVAEFDFRTFDPEGVLFFAGGHQDNTWIVLALRDGRLELQLKYNGIGRVTTSGPMINHGMWQTISVEELERSLVIKVNKDAVMKIAVSGDLFTLDRGLYQLNLTVGGVPFKIKDLVQPINPRLDGCMRGWYWVDGNDMTIQAAMTSNDKMQCFAVAGRGSFYPGSGFAVFNLSYAYPLGNNETRKQWEVKVNLLIRPATDTGMLFALVSSEATVPLSVALIDYHSTKKLKQQFIVLAVKNTVVSRLAISICDEQEHLVDISISNGQIILTVDGTPGQSELSHSQLEDNLSLLDDYLQSSVKTYVGGLPDVPVTSTPVTAFYHGCMTVTVNKQTLDLDEALYKSNDVISHSCPPVKTGQ